MKTIIFNGSPRKNGDTVNLINKLTAQLNDEYRIINAYYSDISPCIDCRYCWSNDGCAINDNMADIYSYMIDCDNVVIASPIYFSQPTGKLLDVFSRFQTYFASRFFRNEIVNLKPKKGAVILVGGGDGNPEDAYKTISNVLHQINVYEIYPMIGSFNTNTILVNEDTEVIDNIHKVSVFLNKQLN